MKIQLLLTGNELMAGHTVDSNSAMIAEQLAIAGFSIFRKVTLGDNFDALVSEMESLSRDSDVLIVNGGLGPTVDDLTAEALSKLAPAELVIHSQALLHLENWCQQRKLSLNDANRKQALLPKGVDIIPNPTGSAVGFSLEHNDCLIICTPGVPSELRNMLDQTIIDIISNRFPDQQPQTTLRFQTFGLGESNIQQLFLNEFPNWPEQVELGFRAGLPQLEVKLTLTNPNHTDTLQRCQQQIDKLIGDYIVGSDNTTLASSVIDLLKAKGKTLTTAESCTGGLIAAKITEVAGASDVFEAGFVTYSNAMKTAMIGVDKDLLIKHGAVSEPVVTAMARGALARSGADYTIAVTGIAGPDGGTQDKPVGTVWIAWGSKEQIKTHCLHFNNSRQWFQTMVSATTLDLIRRELLSITEEPRYLRRRQAR